MRRPPRSTLFPYATLLLSDHEYWLIFGRRAEHAQRRGADRETPNRCRRSEGHRGGERNRLLRGKLVEPAEERPEHVTRSEEHKSELQSPCNIAFRLLLATN